ncbi:hypothetical protein GQ54DRAFT_211909 [Martensiomyces pterosporus]|nr:hypothetical protein GQ54DRAFT_211909 [Martensiomyces pterosporus]
MERLPSEVTRPSKGHQQRWAQPPRAKKQGLKERQKTSEMAAAVSPLPSSAVDMLSPPAATSPASEQALPQDLDEPTFIPVVNIPGSKKLELLVSLVENPVVVRGNQPSVVVRGHVTVLSREVQKARAITVQLHGTKTLLNDQQMGSTGMAKTTIVKLERTMNTSTAPGSSERCAVGTYKLPFEFVLDKDTPPTLHVPRCDIEYTVTATLSKQASAPYLKLIPHKSVKAQKELTIVRYAGTGADPTDFLSQLKAVVKVGTLGSNKNGAGALPYRISMDRNVAAPGDLVGFRLDIYPPGLMPDFSRGEFAALANIAGEASREGHNDGEDRDEYASDNDNNEDEDEDEDEQPANHTPTANLIDAAATADTMSPNTNSGMVSDANDDSEPQGDEHGSDSVPVARTNPIDRPPTYASNRNSSAHNNWSVIAAAAIAGKKTDVTAYKVRAKFVQRVCYLTDHDLVADTADDVYLFWTKRVLTKEKVSNMLDLTPVINGTPLKLEWTMPIPNNLQCDTLTTDIQVRYDIFVDFFPREHRSGSSGKALKDMVSRVNNECVSSRLPLRTIPVSISSLLANPPSYAN